MDEEIPPDLSVLLDVAEISVLRQQGLDPNQYTVITLASQSVAVSHKLPDGSYIMQIQARIPPGLILGKTHRLILPNQPIPSELDGAIGLPPGVRLVVVAARLSDPAREQIGRLVSKILLGPEAN